MIENELLTLYNKWLNDPHRYGEAMAKVVDKIIYSTLNSQSLSPIYHRFEDKEDLIQDMRVICFKSLKKVTEPTNKRIFNFLRISIEFTLKDKTRRTGKRMDREKIEKQTLCDKLTYVSSHYLHPDEQTNSIANMLSHGYNKTEICKTLSISRNNLEKKIEELKEYYG